MVNSIQNLFSAIEPMLRRVVNEEVERGVRQSFRSLTRSPSLRIQALEPSSLKLIFSKKLSLPIFTGSKITAVDNNPLQVILVDTRGGHMVPTSLPQPIKIDIVVLDGDFATGEGDSWTSEDFESKIVKERTGKRPLLTGEVSNITMRDGFAPIGDVEFTDNSSWIRSRKFRIGVKVVAGNSQGIRIREAITEAFVVKDHRGELYKKHHPPMLNDEVWRLEKIGKDGAFHKKLSTAGIKSVQDFLKFSVVDPRGLRARYIENLVKEAYINWHSLEVVEGSLNETALLTQGELVDQYPNNNLAMLRSVEQNVYSTDRAFDLAYLTSISHPGCNDWQIQTTHPTIGFPISESSSDGDLTPTSRSFINRN
ncbi:hypothetical protein Patl1_19153 [Pistacia atlantica]|uniref:Uncharacterized protein n=1 Tax=Pistacia atlantica TaxID=434234 RepID=A0ACC1C1T1_9ROSI|nr:hypothetical protein Patl1_19153 [Pistacia atlantica]